MRGERVMLVVGVTTFSSVDAETILSYVYLVVILIFSNILVRQFNIKYKNFPSNS